MKTISRTITTCKIMAEVVYYNDKKEFVHQPIGSITTTDKEEKVRKNVAAYFNLKDGQTLVIQSIEKEEKVYEVPVEEFIRLADKLRVNKEFGLLSTEEKDYIKNDIESTVKIAE